MKDSEIVLFKSAIFIMATLSITTIVMMGSTIIGVGRTIGYYPPAAATFCFFMSIFAVTILCMLSVKGEKP